MIRFCCLVLVACSLLTSCGDDEGFTSAPIPSGRLTYINTMADSPELTVVTNNLATGNIGFAQATPLTRVLPQIPLDYRISFLNDGVDQTVVESNVTLQVDFAQTIILSGSINNPVVTEIVDDPFEYADGSTDTRIRFLNATSNTASATVTLTNPNGNNETIVMTNGQPTGFTTTTAGEGVELEVTDTSTGAVLYRSGEFILSAAGDRFFVLVDYFGPGTAGAQMISINDPSGTELFLEEELPAQVRFINQTADRGALDYYIDDELAATVGFNGISDFVDAPVGTGVVSVTPAGDSDTELFSGEIIFFSGFFHTFQTASNSDGSGIGTGFFTELSQPIATAARINITKLAPAVTQVDLYFQDAGEGLTGTADFTQITDFNTGSVTVVPDTYDFYVTEAGTTNVLIGPVTLTLDALGIYTIHITDSSGGGLPLQLELLDDFQN